MSGSSKSYFVRLTRNGRSFRLTIIRAHDSLEIARSTKPFSTILEALADSGRVAASMNPEADGVVGRARPGRQRLLRSLRALGCLDGSGSILGVRRVADLPSLPLIGLHARAGRMFMFTLKRT